MCCLNAEGIGQCRCFGLRGDLGRIEIEDGPVVGAQRLGRLACIVIETLGEPEGAVERPPIALQRHLAQLEEEPGLKN
jgi:hypothetical protein